MDDGQRYRINRRSRCAPCWVVAAWPRTGSPRGAGQSGLRAEPRGGRPAGPPHLDCSPLSLHSDSPRGDFDDRPTSA
jgi:hypothetical protein